MRCLKGNIRRPKDKLEDMDVSLENVAARSGPTLKKTLKCLTLFNKLFQNIKICDICCHLQLVSSIFIKSSSNESILKKIKNLFSEQKNAIFRKKKPTQL